MVFSSLSFLFFFIPVVTAAYFILPGRRLKNSVLLLASLFFYSWGEPKLVLLMMGVTFAAYMGGLLTEKFRIEEKPRERLAVQIAAVVLITGNLFVFKYLNFFAENIGRLFGINSSVPAIALPIGVSFYTFQILSYLFDLYKGEVKVQRSYFNLLLYVSFFPQLIAGPIVRYSTIEEEIQNRHENMEDVSAGAARFIIGLGKKVLIANGAAAFSEIIYSGETAVYGTLFYWLAAYAYTLQIYFDFSGYSDMAIGLGRIFGFHFLENFDYPYNATSITEFWRKWHISLSTWFRDYIYIPLGGNRCSKARWLLNIAVVWALTGLWHGASWNFVLWGLYYCFILILEKLFLKKILDRIPGIFAWIWTMVLVTCGWVIFNLTDFSQMLHALHMMFTWQPSGSLLEVYSAQADIVPDSIYIIAGTLAMFPWAWLVETWKDKPVRNVIRWIWLLIILVLSVICLISSSYNPFIYFRF